MKMSGTNMSATATKPWSDTAHPMPHLTSVTSTHSGNVAAVRERRIVLAALSGVSGAESERTHTAEAAVAS